MRRRIQLLFTADQRSETFLSLQANNSYSQKKKKMLWTESETAFNLTSVQLVSAPKRTINVFLNTTEFVAKTLFVSFQTVPISSHC